MTGRIDFDQLAASLDPETTVPQWLPDGRRSGGEWVARNPNRSDKSLGSFSINLRTGAWGDFSTGDEGGDLISLWAYLHHNNDNVAAARDLMDRQGTSIDSTPSPATNDGKVKKLEQPRPILPVPADVRDPDFLHFQHGEPSRVWTYYTGDGQVLLYICRFDHADGSKDIVPRSWCEHPGKPARWTWRGVTGKALRPIYGLDRLAALPDAEVVVVEGEKAADAAQEMLGKEVAVVAWLGGTSCADKVDLRPLRGRSVTLWPDFDAKRAKDPETGELTGPIMPLHDQPGGKAMIEIAKGLGGVASSVMMVGYTPDDGSFPDGWDVADAQAQGWKSSNLFQYMQIHAADWRAIAGGRVEQTADDQDPRDDQPPAADNDNQPSKATPLDLDLNPWSFPHVSGKGAPQNTVENLAYLLSEYGIGVAYNVISKEIKIEIPDRDFAGDNEFGNALATITSLCARNRLPKTELGDYLTLISDSNRVNPAADWIGSKPWDGEDRFGDLAETMDPANLPLATLLLRRWMIGAAASAFCDQGFKMQGILVLQGAQNAGKTTWCKTMAGNDDGLFQEGVMLNPADRDSVKSAISYWLVELGELDATFRKADIAALKSFVTKQRDEVRLPYARRASNFARRTAFFGTVNDKRFLRDDTGNRRYWTIECGSGLVAKHGVDVQQVWAQAAQLWRDGEQHNLTREELESLNLSNDDHSEISPVEELFLSKFNWEGTLRDNPMTATEALIAIGYDRPNRAQVREASAVLQKLTGGEPRKSSGRKVFDLPPKYVAGQGSAFSYETDRAF